MLMVFWVWSNYVNQMKTLQVKNKSKSIDPQRNSETQVTQCNIYKQVVCKICWTPTYEDRGLEHILCHENHESEMWIIEDGVPNGLWGVHATELWSVGGTCTWAPLMLVCAASIRSLDRQRMVHSIREISVRNMDPRSTYWEKWTKAPPPNKGPKAETPIETCPRRWHFLVGEDPWGGTFFALPMESEPTSASKRGAKELWEKFHQ